MPFQSLIHIYVLPLIMPFKSLIFDSCIFTVIEYRFVNVEGLHHLCEYAFKYGRCLKPNWNILGGYSCLQTQHTIVHLVYINLYYKYYQ